MFGSETVGSLVVGIGADTGDLDSKMSGALSSVTSFGQSLTGIGAGLTAGITLPLIGVGVAAVTASVALNEKMANVGSLGIANDRVIELKKNVQDMAISTGKSTGDLAGGLYQVVSAFGDTSDTAKILEINARAAAAGLATTEEAINLTSAITKGYGDTSAVAVQKVADLSLKTVQLGQTTLPELASSLGKVTPLAASLGISMEEMYGVMATATGVTGNTAEVSTQLRGILQSLMAPTDSMQTLMKKLGYSSGVAMIKGLGLQGTVNAISKEAAATHQPLQKLIGSIEGQTLAMQLSGTSSAKLTENIKAMGGAAGATDEAFLAQTAGVNKLGFQWNQLKARLEVVLEQIGDKLTPVLQSLMDKIAPLADQVLALVDKFTKLSPETQTNILMAVGLAAALGPLVTVLGLTITAVAPVVAALGALVSPLGLVIAAVALLGVAWYNNWGGIQEKTKLVMDTIKPYFDSLSTYLTVTFPESISTMSKGWGEKWDTISTKFGAIKTVLSTQLTEFGSWFTEKFPNAMTNVDTASNSLWTSVSSAIDTSTASSIVAFDKVKVWLDATFPNLFTTFEAGTKATWEFIGKAMSDPIGLVLDVIIGLEDWLINKIPDAFDVLKTFISGITFSNPFTKLTDYIDGIKESLTGFIDNLKWLLNLTGQDTTGKARGRSSSYMPPKIVNGINMDSVQGVQNASTSGVSVVVNATVSKDIDVDALAYKISDVIRRRG